MEQATEHERRSQFIAGVGRDAAVWVAGAVPIVLIIALWHGMAVSGLAPPALLPRPATVFLRVAEQLSNPVFVENVGITLLRLFSGFAIAVIAGVGLGLAATASRAVAVLLRPLVRVLAPIPKIALYPALILLLGFDHSSKIALVVADAIFPILLAAWHGMAGVEPKLVWSARAAGASPWRCLLTVVLPAALPSILTGCRVGLVIACIVVFLAEMISSTDGLGNLLVRAARNFQTVDMFVPIIAISALGLSLNLGFNALRARLLAGFPEED